MKAISLLFILHILLVIALIVLRVLRITKYHVVSLCIAVLLPVWGPIILIMDEAVKRQQDRKAQEIEVARMHVEEIMKNVYVDEQDAEIVPLGEALVMNDNAYRQEMMRDILYDVNSSIISDNDDVFENVVPLTEALVFNDAATRRVLVKDVLYTNPSDYVAQLEEAKGNDDTEVVHYAVTALVELQKDFDLKFQNIFRRKEENPEDKYINKEYERLLERYISSGLLEGEGLITQLKNYRDVLLAEIDNGERNWTLQCKLADTDLKLKDKDNLAKDIEEMTKLWPDRDSTYLYRIRYAIICRNYNEIRDIVKELYQRETYMSSELRSAIQFWSDDYEKKIG